MSFRSALSARRTRRSKEVTTATYPVTVADHGKTLLLNRAAGITVTLPADTSFVGFTVDFIVRDNFSGTLTIQGAASGDLFFGAVTIVSTTAGKADTFGPNGSSNDTMVCNSNAKGRAKGGRVSFTLMGANEWLVEGRLHGVGATMATPFDDQS